MDIKQVFGKDYLSIDDYKDIFRELYDEYDNSKIELSVKHTILYKPEDSEYSYNIDLDNSIHFKKYVDSGRTYQLFKRSSINLHINCRNAIRLDTVKEELFIRTQLVNIIIFCLERINVNPEHVVVNHSAGNLEFSIFRRKELNEDEESYFIQNL